LRKNLPVEGIIASNHNVKAPILTTYDFAIGDLLENPNRISDSTPPVLLSET
jgi:hypothetical protein